MAQTQLIRCTNCGEELAVSNCINGDVKEITSKKIKVKDEDGKLHDKKVSKVKNKVKCNLSDKEVIICGYCGHENGIC